MNKLLWVATLLGTSALAIACSSSSSPNDTQYDDSCGTGCNGTDAGGDATAKDGGDASILVCDYANPNNDALCPAAYNFSLNGQPCPNVGLHCAYPGKGDGEANGCYSTAVLICHATDGGAPDASDQDAGDAGVPGVWAASQ